MNHLVVPLKSNGVEHVTDSRQTKTFENNVVSDKARIWTL